MFATAFRHLRGSLPTPTHPVHSQVCPPALLQGLRLWPNRWREWLTGIPISVLPEAPTRLVVSPRTRSSDTWSSTRSRPDPPSKDFEIDNRRTIGARSGLCATPTGFT